MKEIRMVDLKGQYEKIKPEVDAALAEVIDNTAFINGPAVKSFQSNLEKYLGVKHVIPCANGTDALQVSLMALDLKPGDEVITTTFTFIATAEVIALLNLTPVLADVEKDSYNISIEAIKKAITPKTKAIIPVHLFGQSVPMDEIMDLAKAHNIAVIEDACQSIGAGYTGKDGMYRKTGSIGDMGCTSFFPSKNLGAFGDGGAVFTQNDALADKLRMIVNHGMKVRYYHDEIGINSRLDSMQAAILDIKLRHLDEYAAARRKAADYYDNAFKDREEIITPYRYEKSDHVFHQYTLVANGVDRNKLIEYLNSKNVPAMIYYPVPLHQQKAYLDPRYKDGDFPNSEYLSQNVFSLPMHTELDDEQLKYICDSIIDFLNAQ